MKKLYAIGAAALATSLQAPALHAQDIAVRGAQVHTMAGPMIEDGVVVIDDGTIVAVGLASSTPIPAGVQVIEAAVVTPGLVDAHSTVGLSGYLNQRGDQDQLESSSPIQPQLRAIDAYNPNERLVEWVRGFGVTTLHTGHGPGELISGQTMVVKTVGNTVDQAVERPLAMVAANLGYGSIDGYTSAPGTRAKQIAMLRSALVKAQGGDGEKKKGDAPAKRDLEAEVMKQVLSGDVPLLVTAHRAQDILSALRLKEEFGIEVVIDGAAEAYLVLDELKAADVPVIIHPTMGRQFGEMENASFTTAAALRDAGIPMAMQTGFEGYVPKTRVLVWEAAIAMTNGLGFDRALASITIDSARIIGMDESVGSLEVGKDGDIALFSGDPFEYTTTVTGVVIDGVQVSTQEPR